MHSRDTIIDGGATVAEDLESDDSRMWYVRLRIRDDRLAKLWAWNLAEHDVIVWSESDERWEQILAIPELRAEVRKATTSAYLRKRSRSEPPMPNAPYLGQPTIDSEFDAPPRLHHVADLMSPADDIEEPTRVRQRPSSVPPRRRDPMLQALSTSIPPAVLTNPPPEIPRAPKVPEFATVRDSGGTALHGGTSQKGGFRGLVSSLDWRSIPSRWPFAAGSTVKNVGWALVPVLVASAFAIRIFSPTDAGTPADSVSQQSAMGTSLSDWLLDEQQVIELAAARLIGSGPSCSGPAATVEPTPILSPEQLARVDNEELSPTVHAKPSSPARGVAVSSALRERKASRTTGSSVPATVSTSGAGGIDPDAARVALRYAIARAKNCSNAGVSGAALVTFAPSGSVQNVQLSQLVGDDVEPACVSRAFASTRVPPFSGMPVTVRKKF